MKYFVFTGICVLLPIMLFAAPAVGGFYPAGSNHITYSDPCRGWHMTGFETQSYTNADWQNEAKGTYFYEGATPQAPDSLDIEAWNGSSWQPDIRQIYHYFEGHEYVGWIQEELVDQNPPQSIRNGYIAYDGQNRLTVMAMFVNRIMVYTLYITYQSNTDYQVNEWHAATNEDPAYYKKITFEYDGQGRVTTLTEWDSPDSLNWSPSSREISTYNANDTTTGDIFVQRLAHEMPFIIFMDGDGPNFGLRDVSTRQNWYQNAWVDDSRRTYTYDGTLNLASMLEESYENSSWQNHSLQTYSYDANHNNTQLVVQFWDGAWTNNYRVNYSWGEYVGNSDEHTPAANALAIRAYPNPFAIEVRIGAVSRSPLPVEYSVYNQRGQEITKRECDVLKTWVWNGRDAHGRSVATGVYLVKARQGNLETNARILYLK
jgi:hypothetical protein